MRVMRVRVWAMRVMEKGKIKKKKKIEKKIVWIRYIVLYYLFMSPSAIFDSFQTQFLSDRCVY